MTRRLVGSIRESSSQNYKNGTRAVRFFIGLQWRYGHGDGENGGRLQNEEQDQIHPGPYHMHIFMTLKFLQK